MTELIVELGLVFISFIGGFLIGVVAPYCFK